MALDRVTNIQETWKPYSEHGFGVEKEFHELLKKSHPNSVRIDGKFKEYDIKCEDQDCITRKHKGGVANYYEVKSDIRGDGTGNFFIEYMCRGEPSGLATTKSNYWVIADGLYFIVVETEELKTLCRKIMTDHPERIQDGGDGQKSRALLVYKQEILDISLAKVDRHDFD